MFDFSATRSAFDSTFNSELECAMGLSAVSPFPPLFRPPCGDDPLLPIVSPFAHPITAPSVRCSDTGSPNCPMSSAPIQPRAAPQAQVRLKQCDDQPKPGTVHAFDGLVAALSSDSDKIITTPNMTWVPKFAHTDVGLTAHADGRLGLHEYSRWPQAFVPDLWHIHCIPAHPRSLGPGPICFRTFANSDWMRDPSGITTCGLLDPLLQSELLEEARLAITRYEIQDNGGSDRDWVLAGTNLIVSLRHLIDRLCVLPAVDAAVIALAAHMQRLILELYGLIEWLSIVNDRISSGTDYRTDILDVVGAHTEDPITARRLHHAGIPVWFTQPRTRSGVPLEVYQLIEASDMPPDFSRVPSMPPLIVTLREVTGSAGNGDWLTATDEWLCRARLQGLDAQAQSTLPPAKRQRSTYEGLRISSMTSLGHDLRSAPTVVPSPPGQPTSRRGRARAAKRAAAAASEELLPRPQRKIEPFRQFYPSQNVLTSDLWAVLLAQASPTPQSLAPPKYYFPPPWLFDDYVGFHANDGKRGRYLHHWISIRVYCRTRLFSASVEGRPLTVPEWRHALWGHYEVNEVAESASDGQGKSKYRHDLRITIRRLFSEVAALPSYSVNAQPKFGDTLVTAKAADEDLTLRRRVIYEVYETNWRCELLALDQLMTGSEGWEAVTRTKRELLVSRVWGAGTSGIDIVPVIDDPTPSRWRMPPELGWEDCRSHHTAFVAVLKAWRGCPDVVYGAADVLPICEEKQYTCIVRAAVSFYVQVFVETYGRLPVYPVYIPTDFEAY